MKSEIIIFPEEISRKWIDRMANAGISVMGIHLPGGDKAAESLGELIVTMKNPEYRELLDYAKQRGLEIAYELHAAGYLMPRDLFMVHPEYFRMNQDGERSADFNFCVSNPEALEMFAKRAASLALELYGSGKQFYFWMDDGHDTCCNCPLCRELSPSDQQLLVLNAVVKEIRKYIPDASVAYLAYQDTIVPPQKIQAEDGIFLEYAPFEKYTAQGSDAAVLIEREQCMLSPLMDFFGREHAKVLEYWYDNSLYSQWKKPPVKFQLDEKRMVDDVAGYRAMGFDFVATFGCYLGADYEKLHGNVDISPFSRCVGECTPLITQVRPAYFSVDCGMAYVIRVRDGRFILIDSCAGEYEEADHLWDILVSQCETGQTPVIAAWFITHPHRDHFGGFVEFMKKYRDRVRLDSIVYSWASEDICPLPVGSDSPAEFDRMVEALRETVRVIEPYTGQKFVYGDTVFDVLFTWQDLVPEKIPNVNDTSLVMRMEMNGRRVLWLADLGWQAVKYLCENYEKEEFQCEIMQVAHHGYNGASDEFCRMADPSVLLWPCPDFWFPVIRLWEMNQYLITSEKIDTTIVSGQGEVVIDMTTPVEKFRPYQDVAEGEVLYEECFTGERVMDLHWSCITGGSTGYKAAKVTLESGECRLETVDETAYTVCQFVQPGQMEKARDFTLTFSGILEEGAERFGLFWDYPTPTVFAEEHALWLEPEAGSRFTFRLEGDFGKQKARLYLNENFVCEMPYETCGGLYFILKHVAVRFEHIQVQKGLEKK